MNILNSIYIYLILKIFKKNNILNLNLKKIKKKNIINVYIYLKNKFDNEIILERKNNSSVFSSGVFSKFYRVNLNLQNDEIYRLNFNKKIIYHNENTFNVYFNLYTYFFSYFSLKSSIFYNKFYYFYIWKKNEKISFLNKYLFKKNFYKVSFFITNLLYLNYLPYIITEDIYKNDIENLILYKSIFNFNEKYGFIFCTSPYVKLKKITKARNFKIPLISIADINTNTNWIDYPILISKSNKINSYFFFYFILSLFLSSLYFKKKKYIHIYNKYIKLNYLKELIYNIELI